MSHFSKIGAVVTPSTLWYDGESKDLKLLIKKDHTHITTLEFTVLAIGKVWTPNELKPRKM